MKINIRSNFATWLLAAFATSVAASLIFTSSTEAQSRHKIILQADREQFQKATGVMIASGHVKFVDPDRQVQATAEQAQYFSQDHRVILSGNVRIDRAGQSRQTQMTTYLIDKGQFVSNR